MSEELLTAYNTLTFSQQKEVEHFIYFLIGKDIHTDNKADIEQFLNLTWDDGRDADEIIADMETTRTNSKRFGANVGLFD